MAAHELVEVDDQEDDIGCTVLATCDHTLSQGLGLNHICNLGSFDSLGS